MLKHSFSLRQICVDRSLTSLKQVVMEVSSFQSVVLHTNTVLSNPFHSTESQNLSHNPVLSFQQIHTDCPPISLKQDISEVSPFQPVVFHTHMVLSDPFHHTECVRDCKTLLRGCIHHPALLLQQACADRSLTSLKQDINEVSSLQSAALHTNTRSCLTHSTVQNVLEIAKSYSEDAFTTLWFCSSRPVQIAHSPP